jgi:prepilin-type N-terminal cleavage/methylation domain-containing protein
VTHNFQNHQPADHDQAGFSLVELAVVLIIIGVIVAGVLKGQDLIASAKLNGVENQINAIRVAVNTFQNKYGGLPGDIDMVSETMVPGFSVATNTADGTSVRGNGEIEGVRLSGPAGGGTVSEATLFWQHLRGANLLSGVTLDTGGQGVTTTDDALKSQLGGIFSITYDSTFNGIAGNWLELGTAEASGNSNGNALLTSVQMHSLDVKLDDGIPTTGIVGARDGVSSVAGTCINGTGTQGAYVINGPVGCAGYFQLSN